MTTLIQLKSPAEHDEAFRQVQVTLAKAGLPARRGFTFDSTIGRCGAFVSDIPQVIAAFGKADNGTAEQGIIRDAAATGN